MSHNCGEMLKKAVKKCDLGIFDKIIITDDGSTDGSLQMIEKHFSDVEIVIATEQGSGANLKNGLKAAFAAGADYVVEIHGDGAQFHPKATLEAFTLMEKDFDLIVGSRLINLTKSKELGYPFIRMYGNIILSFLYKLLIKVPNSEFHVGYHIYSRRLFTKGIESLSNDYIMPVEIICFAKYHEMKISEVPVECNYLEDHTSHNLVGALWVSIRAFGTIFQYHLAKLGLKTGYLK